jgi:hypothetical protein
MTSKAKQRREGTNVGNVGIGRAGRGDGGGWDVAAADAEYERELLPGTLAANVHGCRCPILANRFGAGAVDLPLDEDGQPQYWVDASCLLHSQALQASNASGAQAGSWLAVALVVSVMLWTLLLLAFGGP